MTKQQVEPLNSLPLDAKQMVLAFSIVNERIGSLAKVDRDDLFDLVLALRNASDPSERKEIAEAMTEILVGERAVGTQPFPMSDGVQEDERLTRWMDHVGKRIKAFRDRFNYTQADLASRSGLTQSHVSQIEAGKLSPTNKTLVKIAEALGVGIGDLDPSSD